MRTAFIDSNGVVVQVILGWLDEPTKTAFLRDYGFLYGAVALLEVDDSTSVWIGGTYTEGQFQPPVQTDPEVIEGTSEELLPLEVPSDSIPS